ncbi:MAG TPA: hypothetical protein VFS20_16690 [Longimicrobium sp.]|nr:hypothetical protein [Longimicrobium sp.]
MKKLKLELDDLAVETFATDRGEVRRGTVAGYYTNLCITYRCDNTNLCTAGDSCDGTCYATCGDEPCASYDINQCGGTAYANSCLGGDCFKTDEWTCRNTCLASCPC